MSECYVYMMASKRNGTLYVGVTNDLVRRVRRHRKGIGSDFVKTYGVKRLVYYERHDDVKSARVREKQMKRWKRAWKLRLVEGFNPEWKDLHCGVNG